MSLSQQLVNELQNNSRNNDLIKARLVLDQCEQVDTSSQKRLLYELNKCDDQFALPLMMYICVRHKDALLNFPSLTDSIRERSDTSPGILSDTVQASGPQQLAYVRLVTDLGLKNAIPGLRHLLNKSADASLKAETLLALGKLEADEAVADISACLQKENKTTLDAAIDALGKIGTPSAVHQLNRLLTSGTSHIRNRAKYRLIELGSSISGEIIRNLNSADIDLLIHSLNILQAIRDPESVQAIRQLINTEPADPNVRFAAYEALEKLPLRKGDYILAAGLTDVDDSVRLAAARAVDLHFDPSLQNGINNMLKPGDSESKRIARAIIDSQSRTIPLQLLENLFFKQFLVKYLSKHGDASLRDYYMDLFNGAGRVDLAEAIQQANRNLRPTAERKKVCAVDDSRMILKAYQSVLNDLSYESVLFEKPADSLDWLAGEKPDLVFTDLNMPEMTGVELIREIRKLYDKKDLPVIMVTTQSETEDMGDAYAAGVNHIISKPFDSLKLKQAIEKACL